jgi:predicted PurR-regulated permease PerM
MAKLSRDLRRLLFFGLLVPIVALNVWVLSQVMVYFKHLITVLIVAAILAFLLDYPVRLFERIRIGRTQAVIIVLLISVALFVLLGVTLVPLLVEQASALFTKIPGWLQASQEHLTYLDWLAKERNLALDLRGFGNRVSLQIESQLQDWAPQALGVALGTLSGFVDGILITVLAFYMLLYGQQLWQGMMNLLPEPFAKPFSRSLKLNFHNFFLSQFVLALFMVVTLIPFFFFFKIPFALLFALLIGIAELIPFIGAALGIGIVTILVAFQDFWVAVQVAVVATLLQQVRDNLIAPKMMGDFTGLNPIWIFVALLMGWQIAGFLGVFIAVPVAGTVKCTIDVLQGLKDVPVSAMEGMEEDFRSL